jgi:crotonobetainyl-CoA:carnitine CoA-transferase CaiB-like acyl-CoA transferase
VFDLLVKRERTGAGSVVDASLTGTASWVLAGDLLVALTAGVDPVQDPTKPLPETASKDRDMDVFEITELRRRETVG